MKRKYLLLILIALATFSNRSLAQALNGNYTIDAGQAPSGTNYQSFATAFAALNTNGVSGPVNFTVAAGTYSNTASLVLNAISGVSTTNTITFNGGSGNAATRIIACSFTSTSNYAVVQLNGSDYIRFKNLTFTTTNPSYGFGLLLNNAADYNIVDSCVFDMSLGGYTTNVNGIVFSASTTSYGSSGNNGNNNIIRNNTIKGGASGAPYFGISMYSNGSTSGQNINNQFINNDIKDFYVYGIYVYNSSDGLLIQRNRISRPTITSITTCYGISVQWYSQGVTIDANVISNTADANPSANYTFYGIYFYYNYLNSTQNIIKNNVIRNISGTGTKYGIYSYYNYGTLTSIYNNTISFDYTGTCNNQEVGIHAYWGYGVSSSYPVNIKNNIVTLRTPSTSSAVRYGMYFQDDFYPAVDNNVILVNGSGASNNVGYWNGGAFATMSAWRAAKAAAGTPFDPNSFNVDPMFTSTTNMVPTNCMINNSGAYLSQVTTDFTGATRNNPPDPGAYEFTVSGTVDAGIAAITSPSGLICTTGSKTVTATLKNLGSTTLTSATINWSVNGTAQTAYNWTGSLAAGATASVNIGTYSLAAGLSYNLVVNSSSPNSTTDACAGNDTAFASIGVGLSGVYTIDPSGSGSSNYTTFTSAVAALSSNGICGPVTFNVAAATYNEQISIPQINGASATNTITFNGGAGNASTRILQYAFGSLSNYAVVDLNGADYVTFKNITIKSTHTSYGWGFNFRGQANYNLIDSCIVDLSACTGGTGTNVLGICFSNSATSATSYANNANYCTISNNKIIGGATGGAYAGIWFYASQSSTNDNTNNTIVNNTIQDFYSYGIYVYYYAYNLTIRGNDISRPNRTATTTLYGIYSYVNYYNTIVDGNKIHNMYGGSAGNTNTFYGIYTYNNYTGTFVTNNAIYDIQCAGSMYGINTQYNYYCKFFFNTISFNSVNTNNNTIYGFYDYYGTTANNGQEVKNNIISITAPGSGVRYGFYEGYPSAFPFSIDYNDYNIASTGATNYTGYFVSNATTLAAWQTLLGSGRELNSVNINPMFSSLTTSMQPTNCALDNKGVSVATTTDITGANRGSIPDMGAYEFSAGAALDATISSLVNPSALQLCPGNQSIVVKLKNNGTTTLTSASIGWSVNGTPQTPYSWSGSLTAGAEALVTIGTYTFPTTSTSFAVWTSTPNGGTDGCSANDTTYRAASLPGMSGAYTINPSGSGSTNFTTFAAAVAALNAQGVCGPVVFNVAAASYLEKVTLLPVLGASSVNTITFNGGTGNAATRIVLNPTGSPYAGIRLNGADYFIIKNLTLKPNTGVTSNYFGVQLMNKADYNIIDSCIIDMSTLTSGTGTTNAGIVMSSSLTAATGAGSQGKYNIFRGNQILGAAGAGAYYGISLYSGSATYDADNVGNMVIGNTIKDFYVYGIYDYYMNATQIIKNDISKPARTAANTFYGLYSYYVDGTIIDGNKVHTPFGGALTTTNTAYGMYIYGRSNTNLVTVKNNAIYDMNFNGPLYGLYIQYEYNLNVLHNSISLDQAASTTSSATQGLYVYYSYYSAAYPAIIRNNIVSVTRGGTGTKHGMYLSYYYFNVNNNNVIVSGGTGVNYYGYLYNASVAGVNYSTLAAWQAATTFDASSSSLTPSFTNLASDLTPTNVSLNNTGTPLASVTTDISGLPRSTTTPDMGAYEWGPACTGTPTVAGILISTPPGTAVCGVSATLTAQYTVVTGLTFQWQSSSNGSSWSNVGGATNYTYTTPPISGPLYYRCAVTCSGNTAYTNAGLVMPGLSGTYTIDVAGSGPNNFTSFTNAVAALNTFGVCGAVTFNVASGSYNERFTIPAVAGVSATNTITFNGGTGNASTRVIQYNNDATDYSIIDLNGADYITFKNLTIQSSNASYGYGILFRNGADYNVVDSCVIDLSSITTASTTGIGIVFSGSNVNYSTTGVHGNYNIIRNNTIKGSSSGGPYFGISMYCQSTSVPTGNFYNQFINNDITDFYSGGMYIYYSHIGTVIRGNRISRPNRAVSTTVYGIYTYYYWDQCVIENNKIFNPYGGSSSLSGTFYGLYMSYSYDKSNIIRNNLIYNSTNTSGTNYGIYSYYTYNNRYYHNTVAFNDNVSGTVTNYGIYSYGSTGAYSLDYKNNLISITRPVNAGYFNYGFYAGNTHQFTADNNLYYMNSANAAANIVGYNGSNYITLGAWQSTGFDMNGSSVNPLFASYPTNLTPGCAINAKGANVLAYAPLDINGVSRTTLPDPGVQEINSGASDAALATIISPSLSGVICGSTPIPVTVKLVNSGSDTLRNATIDWAVNGNTPTSYSWSGTLAPGASTNVTLTNFNFAASTQNNFVINAKSPNGQTDACNFNDTLYFSKAAGISGTFTIDPAGAGANNFVDFISAVNTMAQNGICGPVTFNVAAATYNGRVVIPQIAGSSSVNTITFDGGAGNAASRIISYDFADISSYALVQFNGADYVRFKNITVKTTSATYGWGFVLGNGANYNIIDNCVVDLSNTYGSASTANMGIVFSPNGTSYSTFANHANYNVISNNVVKGGYYGISFYGSSSSTTDNTDNQFINNDIKDFYYMGMYLYYYAKNMVIRGNTISRPNRSSVTTFYGIYSYQYPENRVIENNIITNPFGGSTTNTNTFYGIVNYYEYSNNGNVIRNNQIYGINGVGTKYGIYSYYCYNTSINHNTIVFDSSSASSNYTDYGIYAMPYSSGSMEIKNNIIKMIEPATSTAYYRVGLYFSSAYSLACNGNVYWINGAGATNYIGYNSNTAIYYSTLAAWQAGVAKDLNGVSADPMFTSSTNYTPVNPVVNNTGLPAAGQTYPVTVDFNGKVRNTASPDAGAIEWTPLCYGADLVQGTPYQGTMRSGTYSDFDHLKAGTTVTYNYVAPTGYTNAGYGTTWDIQNLSYSSVNGFAAASSDTATLNPSAGGSGYFRYSPSSAYTDSMYILTFKVRSLSGGECESVFSRVIYVAPLPQVDFDTTAGCYTVAKTIQNLSNILRGTMSFNWNFGDTVDNTSIQSAPTHTFSHPGLFTISLTATSDLGYSSSVTKSMKVSYLPVTKFDFQPACLGNLVSFTNQSTVAGGATLTYNWNFGDNTGSNSATPSKTYSSIGTYNVSLTANSSEGCVSSATKTVTIFPVPVVDFTATNPCAGENATFTNGSTLAYGNLGYSWNFGDGSTDIVASPIKKYTTQGTYNVKLIAYSEYGCKDSITKSVTIGTVPTAAFGLTKWCDNDSASFSNSSTANGGPSITSSWSFGDLTSSNSSASVIKHMYPSAGMYHVMLIVTNGSCSDTAESHIDIEETPTAYFAVSGGVCQGNATTFNNLSTGTDTLSYSWNFDGTGISTAINPTYTFPGAGTFNVVLNVNSSNGCSNSFTKPVSVFTQPSAAFTTSWNTPFNKRQQAFFAGNQNLYSYSWNFGDGIGTSQQVNPVYSYFSNGPFTVKLKVSDANGCTNEHDTIINFIKLSTGNFNNNGFSFDVYPNPFRGNTTVNYTLERAGEVEVKVYDITGKEITSLVNATKQEVGSYKVNFDASAVNAKSGIYFIRLRVDGVVVSKQVIETK